MKRILVIALLILFFMVSIGYCSENRWGQVDLYRQLGKVHPGYVQATGTALGGATSMATSTSAVPVSYSFVKKEVCAAADAGATGAVGTLANGTKGQIIKIFITGVGDSGSWVLTPDTAWGFTTLTFDAQFDEATLLYVDSTIGWILIHSISTTVGGQTSW